MKLMLVFLSGQQSPGKHSGQFSILTGEPGGDELPN